MSEKGKIIGLDEKRNKTQAEKIIERHVKTGQKLTQQEAITILAEMSQIVNTMQQQLNIMAMRMKGYDVQLTTTSAREIALFKLLQNKKQLFTEDEFKEAWQEFIMKPLEEQDKKAKEAEENLRKKITNKAKEDSLNAAQEKTNTESSAAEVQESEVSDATREVSEE